MKNCVAYLPFLASFYLLMGVSKCESPKFERSDIPPVNGVLEARRRESAREFSEPRVTRLLRDGKSIWEVGLAAPTIVAGETLEIEGTGFGAGPDVDYAKVLVGRARVLESDLQMFTGHIDVKKAHYFEILESFDSWPKEFLSWENTRIRFKVPETTDRGPLVVSVQKRMGANTSLLSSNLLHSVWDPNSERVHGPFAHQYGVVSRLSEAKLSQALPVVVSNPKFKARVADGEKIFWSYDYNIGATHNARDQDWSEILEGRAIDPITGKIANASELFGAIPITASLLVPKILRETVNFDPYPIPNPLTSVLGAKQLYSGSSQPTGYVGYVSANSLAPATGKEGRWTGFSCASCHGQGINYPDQRGRTITKVFPGLPNPKWSLKWTILSKFKGFKGEEEGIEGAADKSMLIYHVPNGAGEHTLVRSSLDSATSYRNDFLYSPIAIPSITTHTPLRRSLSHTEMYAGFEGSYVHAEEPDGAIGSMYAEPLKSLTAYMTTLDQDDAVLRPLGLYRWLKEKKLLGEVSNVSEKEFLYSDQKNYPMLMSRLERGQGIYAKNCVGCHASNFGTGTDENMLPLNLVGSYFSPTIYQLETQSIRTAMMTNLYWVQKRGLLHDTHVRSLEDLVDPARCDSSSSLYKKYYTMHSGSFRIPIGTPEQAKATEKTAYFTRVSWDSKNFYWDYQKMIREFGPRELKSNKKIILPKTPHPWCLAEKTEIPDLVAYLLML